MSDERILPHAGILGGGQLALMLGQALLGEDPRTFHLSFLTNDLDAPVKSLSSFCDIFSGSDRNESSLREFFRDLDLVLFENEFVDVPLLRRVARDFPKLRFFPAIDSIELCQDKLKQKQKWAELGLPTSPFVAPPMPIAQADAVLIFLRECQNALGTKIVLKWNRQGYDGKGVAFVDSEVQDGTPWVDFFARARAAGSEVFAEKFTPFTKELALIGVKSGSSFCALPLVESEQLSGTCLWVKGPFSGAGRELEEINFAAQKIAEACRLSGSFGLELFWVDDPKTPWLINEIAPRVHNSGHYSQDTSFSPSQFALHWQAARGETLRSTSARDHENFGMLNLLGPPGVEKKLHPDFEVQIRKHLPKGAFLHWYGKSKTSPKRKLGHINWNARNLISFEKLEKELVRFNEFFQTKITKEN